MSFDSADIIQCADCGVTTLRRSPSHRFCAACSGRRDTDRKAQWAKANPQQPAPDRYEQQQSAMVAAGVTRSEDARAGIDWIIEEVEPLRAVVRVAVPFDWAGSKNAIWRTGRGGHVYAREEATRFRETLAAQIRGADATWYQGKVWIDIFVEKPNHRGDATNFVDIVCDAVKDATGVDDRWYSIRRLDWSIVKDSPRVLVGVAQAVGEDHQVCSHCGRSLRLDQFGRNRSTQTGRSRVCRDCGAPRRGPRMEAAA